MNNSNRISARVLLAVASLAFSPAAWSLGLGDVTVESYLNQPLRARIDLISSERDDLSTVTAKLASAADYELIGASLEDLSVPVRFAVEQEGGDAYIVASSNVPVNNPILRLIVEGEALGPQCDALVNLHPVADDTGLTNHNTGSMINETGFTDCGTWMDVNAGC